MAVHNGLGCDWIDRNMVDREGYSNQKMEQVRIILDGGIDKREGDCLLIGGDFNARD